MTYTRKNFLLSLAAAVAAPAAVAPAAVAHASAKPTDTDTPAKTPLETTLPPMENTLSLWYQQPAREWLEALPIGNGVLAAMVFGGVGQEKLAINHGSLWAGGPHNYDNPDALAALPEIRRLVFAGEWTRAQDLANAHFMSRPLRQMPYQTAGNLTLTFPGAPTETPTNFRRDLDLDTAVARVAFTAEGVRYEREAFASAPGKVIAVRLTADKKGHIAFTLGLDSPQKNVTVTTEGDDTLLLSGTGGDGPDGPGAVHFQVRVHVSHEGGSVHAETNRLTVTNADAATVLLSIATSYVNHKDAGGDHQTPNTQAVNTASRLSYTTLRQAHVAEYQRLFRRVRLDLGPETNPQPTDVRVKSFGNGHADPALAALHFQYGRYLLISCSRPGGQPATLQGLWNDSLTPPWDSKYTININTEMNYWPAGPANLLETYEPLFRMLGELAESGARTAKTHYGASGWVAHHNTDGWRGAAPVDGAFWGLWPTGGAWLCRSLWDHYEFTGDVDALRKHYPLLRGAAQFFLDTLVEEPTHRWLVTCPSVSPEHGHHPNASICAGPTMDTQILRDLFDATIQASELLRTDAPLRDRIIATRARLAPMHVGKAGQLQEWLADWDMEAEERHHRHVSHLYGLHPSHQITPSTPDLFAAARKTLEIRGDLATGWSLAWKINFWARLLDGDRAYKLLTDLLTPDRTAPNLFDLHPPFQIDGNFGATAGICELLLQSQNDELHLLPALPSAWPHGSVHGLRARHGFEVDLTWQNGKLTRITLLSHQGKPCHLRSNEHTITLPTQKGKRYTAGPDLAFSSQP